MPLASILNNQFLWATYTTEDGTVELRGANIPLEAGVVYKLSFMVRSSVAQQIRIQLVDSGLANDSIDAYRALQANTWRTLAFEFTAQATDSASILRIHLEMTALHNFYIDKAKLIDLTQNRKEYRLMRVRGSMMPGSFIQKLTLREKTANETA